MPFGASSNTDELMRRALNKEGVLQWLAVFAFFAIAGFLLYLPSELGASLAIPPDSTEYSIGLANLFEHGRFGFTLNGEWYPSRYAPWFSLFCLAPAYLVFYNVLSLHWAVLFFALAFLWLSYMLGRLAGLGKWSFACLVLPLFIPDFVFYSRMVMTEIPYTTIIAASALVFARFSSCRELSFRFCFGVGVLVTWGGAARATALPMVALFMVALFLKKCEVKRKMYLALTLLSPVIVYGLANLVYNRRTFGSFFRNGYQYWVSVPCDYKYLSFNFEYLLSNVSRYLNEPVALVTLCMAVFISIVACLMLAGHFGGLCKNRKFLLVSGYVLFQGIVLSSLYIGYYWCDVRFFLPVMLCLIPLFLGSVISVVGNAGRTYKRILMIMLILLCIGNFHFVVPRYFFMARGYPITIVEAGISRKVLPAGAVVIQEGNPLFIDFLGPKENTVECFPIYRCFDYTNAMITPSSIAKIAPKPTSWRQRIIPALVESGVCRLPFPKTLSEDAGKIKDFLEEGRRVFLHLGVASAGDEYRIFKLLEGFELKEYGVWSVPAIEANPVRRLYDRFIFPSFRMDSRPEVQCVYYEIMPKGKDPAGMKAS